MSILKTRTFLKIQKCCRNMGIFFENDSPFCRANGKWKLWLHSLNLQDIWASNYSRMFSQYLFSFMHRMYRSWCSLLTQKLKQRHENFCLFRTLGGGIADRQDLDILPLVSLSLNPFSDLKFQLKSRLSEIVAVTGWRNCLLVVTGGTFYPFANRMWPSHHPVLYDLAKSHLWCINPLDIVSPIYHSSDIGGWSLNFCI